MINLEELLTERELYVYRNYPEKNYRVLGEELGVGTSRIGQIRNSALRKIRHEKRCEMETSWYQESVSVNLKQGELHLLKRTVQEYKKNIEVTIWNYRNGDVDPELEQCQELINKLNEVIEFAADTHPVNKNYDAYLNPDISDVT